MTNIPETLAAGLEHHRAGRLQQAEIMYRRVLQIHPRHAEAMHLLGLIAFQARRLDVAELLLNQAVQLDAFRASYSADLGEIYRAQGKIPEAIAAYRRAVELQSESADFQNNLGTLLQTAGDLEEAAAMFQEALSLNPQHPQAAGNLAAVWHAQGQLPEAQGMYETAAKNAPNAPKVYLGFGRCLHAQGDLLGAIACFQKAARLAPDWHLTRYHLGRSQQARGELDEAAVEYGEAIRLAPQFAKAHYSLGIVRRDRGRTADAIRHFEDAARCDPTMVDAHLCLANIYLLLDEPDKAEAASRIAVGLQPDSVSAAAHLAAALQAQGDLKGAIAEFRRTLELAPDDISARGSLIHALNFDPACQPPEIFAEHLEWARRHAEPLTAQAPPHENDRAPDRRLRIGYVSAHFREHAVSFFSLPLLAAHDHEQFEIFCYSNALDTDPVTARFQQAADVWRPVATATDEELAALIRQDKIDVLVDLAGHIRGHRLLALARKPAPVQVTYLGYQNTTGMTAMDYRLTDEHADPPGTTDTWYTEKLVRLPGSFFCYSPLQPCPDVNELPALAAGHVTLAWFNYVAKTTGEAIETWGRVLAAVPNARLLVLAHRGGSFEARVHDVLAAAGVDPDRLEIINRCPPDEYLRLHHRVDIALDSFPFNGHTTICNALWMGVPSVVRQGTSYASRFGGSALVSLGLTDLIAGSDDEYVEIVARLAEDLPRLAELRRRLRAQMAESPLMDEAAFARHVEQAYRRMWQQWCRSE